jgi:Uma2 family endonuclease
MSVLARHRFSTEDYYRMARTGVLKPDARVELLDGEIIDMAPIGPLHGGGTNYLNEHFTARARGRYLVAIQNPVHLDQHSAPQPDLMLLKRATDYYRSRHPRPEDVFLLIEVADTSLAYDRERKLPAYARAGITEVWIVNLEAKTFEVNREPHLAGYHSSVVLRVGEQARPVAFPDLSVDLAEFFR